MIGVSNVVRKWNLRVICASCSFAAEVWGVIFYLSNSDRMQFQSFMDLLWFLWDSQQCNDDALSLAIVIAWAMWTRRNERRNGKKVLSGPMLIQWVGRYIAEFRSATEKTPLVNETCSLAWVPPTTPLYKVNSDATIFYF